MKNKRSKHTHTHTSSSPFLYIFLMQWICVSNTEQFDRGEGAGTFSSTFTSFFLASSFWMFFYKYTENYSWSKDNRCTYISLGFTLGIYCFCLLAWVTCTIAFKIFSSVFRTLPQTKSIDIFLLFIEKQGERTITRIASMSSSSETLRPSRRARFSSPFAVFLSVFSLPFPGFFVFLPINATITLSYALAVTSARAEIFDTVPDPPLRRARRGF